MISEIPRTARTRDRAVNTGLLAFSTFLVRLSASAVTPFRAVVAVEALGFPTSGTAGTTLTVMALTLRACGFIADEMDAGRL